VGSKGIDKRTGLHRALEDKARALEGLFRELGDWSRLRLTKTPLREREGYKPNGVRSLQLEKERKETTLLH
jgi:hypothetical protein